MYKYIFFFDSSLCSVFIEKSELKSVAESLLLMTADVSNVLLCPYCNKLTFASNCPFFIHFVCS